MAVQAPAVNLMQRASEVTTNSINWLSTKASSAATDAGNLVQRVISAVQPFFAEAVAKTSAFLSGVKDLAVSSFSSARRSIAALPLPAKVGVAVALAASAIYYNRAALSAYLPNCPCSTKE
ncbi:MAG: hypothetical protein COT85_07525 [Chlamydiae bacterium CG10_big_fil_rev_8_21_14_0_10_42_34]|nr:MAG: hypothetical protein COT85_07525 [Chlamydiae bacterium CG10_big_fil_rev_8_21_14_0_10_42_34]